MWCFVSSIIRAVRSLIAFLLVWVCTPCAHGGGRGRGRVHQFIVAKYVFIVKVDPFFFFFGCTCRCFAGVGIGLRGVHGVAEDGRRAAGVLRAVRPSVPHVLSDAGPCETPRRRLGVRAVHFLLYLRRATGDPPFDHIRV